MVDMVSLVMAEGWSEQKCANTFVSLSASCWQKRLYGRVHSESGRTSLH